jgi:putative ABC transport system permease protein
MSMLRLALLGLRGRRSTFAGAAVALFLAAVLVSACGVLLASAVRSTPTPERYAGAPIVVAGQQTLHQRVNKYDSEDVPLPERVRVASALASRLADVPGVRSVVPDVSVRTQVLGAHGAVPGPGGHDTFAHGWSSAALTPLTLHAGRPPARPGEVVLDAGLARRGGLRVGARVRLGSTDRAAPLTVVGIADARPPLKRQAAVFVSDAEAERLGGHPGRTDAIALLTERGADTAKVAAAARVVAGPDVAVLTGSRRGGPEFPKYADAREGLMALTGMFGVLALVIALFVIAGTLGLAIQLREREIALLRAIAATPRQVRRMLRWEAVILALVASAAGYLPGVALAHELIGAFSARGLAPEGMQVAGGIVPPLVTVVASVLCALAAAWAGSRRASKVPPTRALQESAVEPRLIGRVRLLAGLVAAAGGGVLIAVATASQDQDTALGAAAGVSLVLVVAAACLGPLAARVAAIVPGRLVARMSPVSGFLATAQTRTAPRRVASAMTPLVLSVAMACTLLFSGTTQATETANQAQDRQLADLVLSAPNGGVPEAAVNQARHTPGVAAAIGIAPTGVLPLDNPALGSGYTTLAAQMVDAEGASGTLDLGVRSGSIDDLHGETVAIAAKRAESANVAVGDRVNFALGDGTRVRLRVVATYDRSLGFGEFVLPRELAAPHATERLADAVLVRTAPGASLPRVKADLANVAAAHPGMQVGGKAALRSEAANDRKMVVWINRVLAGLIFIFTAIAAVNTLAMIALSRERELALLRLVGATPRQVARMARWEAGLVVMVGIGLGAAIAAAALVPFSQALTGSHVPDIEPRLLAGILGGTALLGLLASLLPTRLALRTQPVDAIGLKE